MSRRSSVPSLSYPAAVSGGIIALALLFAACASGPVSAVVDDCLSPSRVAIRPSVASLAVLSPSGPRVPGALGHAHNEGVREIFRRAAEFNPDPQTLDELSDAMVVGARGYAEVAGFDPVEMETVVKRETVRALERQGVRHEGRVLAARLRAEPAVRNALDRQDQFIAKFNQRVNVRRVARGGAAQLLGGVVTDSSRFLDAGADITIDIMDTTVSAVSAAAATTISSAFWNGQIVDTVYENAVYALEEIADSSRFMWEEVALDAWITSGGTYFPEYADLRASSSFAGNAVACDGGGLAGDTPRPANFIACPWCLGAAVGAVGADVITAISNYDNNVAHPVGSVVGSSAAGAVFGAAATPGVVSGGVSRLTGWVSKFFS